MHNYNSDRFGSNTHNQFAVQKLASQLNYPVEDIMRAIQEVGFDEDEVEEYIRDRYNRS